MNFRVNLAVALAAAFSFACAQKPAAIPELEQALTAPEGLRVVGLYRMDVTPVQTPEGVQFAWASVPVGLDGNPLTNPGGTVQVKGTFGAVTPWAGPGFVRCANGVNTISAAVTITNFAVDPLTQVYAQILDMTGHTGNVACNPAATGGFTIGDRAVGVWAYPNLAPSPSPTVTGAAAGGAGTATWTLRYVTTTPFRFFFRVVAENNAPVQTFVDPAGPAAPLSWTSTVAANSVLEICSADPGFLTEQPLCPVALSVNTPVAGTGAGPWSFSYAFPASTLVNGNVYYSRVKNVFPLGQSTFYSQWFPFTYNGAGATAPTVAPSTFLANDAQAIINWTTVPTVTQSYMYLCQGPCPATLPLAANPVQGNVLFQGAFVDPAPTTVATYSQDVAAFLLPDALTLTYFDPAVAYEVRVFEYDGITQPITTAAGATAAITITPVQVAPTLTEPASYSAAAATWPVTWTADPLFTTTQVDMCLPDCITDGFPATAAVTAVAGVYSYDVKPLIAPVTAGQLFELRVTNPDLIGVYGSGGPRTVAP